MKDLLVGSTGFVGGNLLKSHEFSGICHSSDVKLYDNTKPELCVYAGVPAAMFLANSAPEKDREVIRNARENLRRIAPEKVVLISTIAVYSDSYGKTESDLPCEEGLSAYGKNRLQLEHWVREDFPNTTVLRLPALYGTGLKKNFLFDLHTIIPAMLKAEKYAEISCHNEIIKASYTEGNNGFYVLKSGYDKKALRRFFLASDFNALSFTDSRSRYQFYPLNRLWSDITIALASGTELLNVSTPPVSAQEIYNLVTGKSDWVNEITDKAPFDYDMHTNYADIFGHKGEYLCTKEQEKADILHFMTQWKEENLQ